MSENDKRKHERTTLEVTVDWQEIGSEDVIWSATGDVGAGGIKVRTLTPPAEGTAVIVVLGPTEQVTSGLRVPGRVAWVRMEDDFCGMGVAFEPADDEQRSGLRNLLGRLTHAAE